MNIKKLIIGISLFSMALIAFTFYSGSVRADDRRDDKPEGRSENLHSDGIFNPDRELSKSACGDHLGSPVINVTQKVQNDRDDGQGGNIWAFDYYKRHIKVWSTGEANTYCAVVTYDGNFYTVPGQQGPGGTGALIDTSTNAPVNGNMSAGYRATFNGTLTPGPWPTNGNVGTTNYQCNILAVCPGYVDWVAQYFPGYSGFAQPWWGWKYNGGSHGTWINSSDGNSGNIL